MINEILAVWTPGPSDLIVVFFVFFLFFLGCVAPAVGLISLVVLCLLRKGKERKELHKQVQELTEEVARLKQQQE